MGGFSLGCGLGWSAPSVEILRSQLDDFAINVIASVLPIGAALGTLVVPLLVDRIGRKWTMMVLVPVLISGWILLICAGTVVPFYVIGRLVTGACGGMCCVLAPMYSAEISEKHIRGTTGVFFQLMLVIGILYVYCTGFTRDVVAISSLCIIAPIVFGVTMAFVPESPLFYLTKDKEEDARKSMRFFRGPDFDIEPEMSAFKMCIRDSCKCGRKQEQVERSKFRRPSITAFTSKPVLKTLAVAYGLMFTQQFSGINAIIFYGLTILESTGVGMESQLELVIFGVVQVVACVAAALLIDQVILCYVYCDVESCSTDFAIYNLSNGRLALRMRSKHSQLGRKLLMAISMSTMCACLSALAGFFILKSYQPELADRMHWLPLTSVCVYILAFCLGAEIYTLDSFLVCDKRVHTVRVKLFSMTNTLKLIVSKESYRTFDLLGPIPWAYMGEIFPTRLKGAASSSAAFFNWLLAFTVTITFPSAIGVLDNAVVFSFFALMCALGTLFVIFFMVETKDKTFTEIEQAYGTHVPVQPVQDEEPPSME
ncbi:Facilitated trehalose transporter Tret1-2-like protein [Temnothorax longispinosus]|uniref:Facilitated trehalose transporter Tret1-2-like protein n=1 Tax=Temnothorax longispinosus TaxID=300112 RepID=A0A4S2KAC3_9HYME|nr:Facilitated trehalose transporter Tret1-2-like protein [Temnothorax longispinosus]